MCVCEREREKMYVSFFAHHALCKDAYCCIQSIFTFNAHNKSQFLDSLTFPILTRTTAAAAVTATAAATSASATITVYTTAPVTTAVATLVPRVVLYCIIFYH